MDVFWSSFKFFATYWSTFAIGGVILSLFLYWYGTRSRNRLEQLFPGLTGPKLWPFIGCLPDVIRSEGQMHLQFDEDYKKYGKIYRTLLLSRPTLVVSDPEMIKDIFVKNFDSFHNRMSFAYLPEPFDKGLDIAVGESWRRIRNLVSPTFSAHKLKMMVPMMNVRCDALINKVEEFAKSGETFNIVKHQQALTLDVIMSTAFGIQTDYQNNPNDPVIKNVLDAVNPSSLDQILFFFLMMLPLGKKIIKIKAVQRFLFRYLLKVADIAREVVETKRRESTQKDFLDMLLQATSTEALEHKKLSNDEVVAQCMSFILDGYVTTSFTLSMLSYSLATNPDVQERLQEEIDSVWTDEDEMPSYDTVHDLPYLNMVLSETLRLYPPGFLHMRECNKDCVIQGIKIPNKVLVIVPVYSIQRDPNIYPDPEKFDPERFSAEAKQSRDPYLYSPFGIGPRSCVGMRFAQMEIKLVLIRLLKKYSFFKSTDTKPPQLKVKQTLICTGVDVGVRRRDAGGS